MRRVGAIAVILPFVLTSCGTGQTTSPELPVPATEAATVLNQVAQLAAQRTSDAAAQVCTDLADSCDGMSSRFRADPGSAPETPPTILCDIQLPAIPGQQGPRVLVITGKDAQGENYAGQVLVLRRHGHPLLHEPAFWIGTRYTQLTGGRAWEGASDDKGERAKHDVAVRKACSDPAAFVAAVIPTASRSGIAVNAPAPQDGLRGTADERNDVNQAFPGTRE